LRSLRAVILTAVIAAAPLLNKPLRAETLGDARVGFSAERVLTIDGQSYVGKMWHMPGEQRHEQDLPAVKAIFILHRDSTTADIVLPKLHTVVEFALPRELSILDDPSLRRTPVAQDTIEGIETTKYAVNEETPQGRATGWLWLSEDGIPMKCDATFTAKKGKVSSISWELRGVKMGNQDAALFNIPPGYAKLSAEAAAPLLGIRLARP
jgi:hypothetical protein